MIYLIDGHNLIARTPGLSLADPDDEAKLVQLLRRWAAGDQRRKVIVIFDAGLPGGESRHLSGGGVKVIFAPNNSSADTALIRRIEAVRDPTGHTVVSSDAAIAAAATRRRITVQRSEAFAAEMIADRTFGENDRQPAERPDAPQMSSAELEEWLALFGPEPESPRPKKSPRKPKESATLPPKKKPKDKKEAEELDEWLRLFGYKE